MIAISLFIRLRLMNEFKRNPDAFNIIIRTKTKRIYLMRGFKKEGYLRKSFTAVYMAAKTPKRESIIVKTGFSKPATLSSFMPPQVVTRIIPIIWNAIPEYRAKSLIPLFPGFFRFFFFCCCCSSVSIAFAITHFAGSGKLCSRFDRKF